MKTIDNKSYWEKVAKTESFPFPVIIDPPDLGMWPLEIVTLLEYLTDTNASVDGNLFVIE